MSTSNDNNEVTSENPTDIPSSSLADIFPAIWEEEESEMVSVDFHEQTSGGAEVVRPDRNLERWPIWEPANSHNAPKARLIQREMRLPDGRRAAAVVKVGFTERGVLTTEDQKTFYALIKLWEDLGKPKGRIPFSRQQLSRILKRSWGKNVNHALTESLMRLRFTPFVWERSFFNSQKDTTEEHIDTFNILSELQLNRRSVGGNTRSEGSTFEFNERLLSNLLAGYTRPVYLDTILSFRSELAQILYTYLDLVLFDKPMFKRRTLALFQDLGLDNPAYKHPSKRAQVLEAALKELQGAPLPSGTLTSVSLERTVDDKDFNLVAVKTKVKKPRKPTKGKELPEYLPPVVTTLFSEQEGIWEEGIDMAPKPQALPAPRPIPTSTRPTASRPASRKTEPEDVTKQSGSATKQSSDEEISATQEQVKHFYQVFFKTGDSAEPSPKELKQAAEHVVRLGEERARYLVQFAYREAKLTKFAIQTYGGILQYEARAIAEFDENLKKRADAVRQRTREHHYQVYQGAFFEYLGETLAMLREHPEGLFLEFLEEEEKSRKIFSSRQKSKEGTEGTGGIAEGTLGIFEKMVQSFDTKERQLARFREFLNDKSKEKKRVEGVMMFWEWDKEMNPEPFEGN
jgi:hypothetical protein